MSLQLPYLINPDALKAVRFGGKKRSDLKDSDFVFSDDRAFPIMIAADVSGAVSSWGRYKGKHTFDEFKKNLTALAKRKGFAKELPAKWETPAPSGKSIGELTNIKAGARNASADQTHLDQAHNHLVSAGATCPGADMTTDEAKSLAVKMLDTGAGFNAQYAMQEGWDIQQASQILGGLASLASSEAAEGEPEDVTELTALMNGVLEFIEGEIEEMAGEEEDLIESCRECLAACASCAAVISTCQEAEPTQSHQACIAACETCAEACKQVIAVVQQFGDSSPECQTACEACTTACETCKAACEALANDCMECADECEECLEECDDCIEACKMDDMPMAMGAKSIVLNRADTLISFGGAVKSLDNGHLGGYLVRFSTKNDPDLTGDYFDKETDYGFTPGMTSPIYFNHRVALKTRGGKYLTIKDKIGEAKLNQDDYGVTIDAIIYNRELYQQAINDAAQTKSLNWSSGTAAHLVDRAPVGKAQHVTKWPLGVDASLTPIAAEPRNEAYPLKALASLQNVVPQTKTSHTQATATSTGAQAQSEIEREGERLRLDLLELEMNLH